MRMCRRGSRVLVLKLLGWGLSRLLCCRLSAHLWVQPSVGSSEHPWTVLCTWCSMCTMHNSTGSALICSHVCATGCPVQGEPTGYQHCTLCLYLTAGYQANTSTFTSS